MGARCDDFKTLFVPPRSICVECGGSSMCWESDKGTGELKVFTCISLGPPFMQEEGYNRKRPYCKRVIELDQGPRVVVRIENVEASKPETFQVGMPVKATSLRRDLGGQETVYLAVEPA